MKISPGKGIRKHIKWIFVLLIISTLYAVIGINGWRSLGSNDNTAQEIPYSVNENKISVEIPAGRHALLQVSNLPAKQETVAVSFYDMQKELIESHDIVLCNGINDLGKYKENISFFKYSSATTINIEGVYYTDNVPVDITGTLKIGVGIFLLCCIQYCLVMIKRKYVS